MSTLLCADPKRIERLAAPFKETRALFKHSHSIAYRFWWMFRHQFKPFYFTDVPTWRFALRSLASHRRVLPDFAIIGAVRSGTSALSQYVLQHPCIVLPIAKEPNFKGVSRREILAAFPLKSQLETARRTYGAAMTGYCVPTLPVLWWPRMAHAMQPDLKVVVILRDPVARTFSHWRWDLMGRALWVRNPEWDRFPDFDETMRLELASVREGGSGFRPFSGAGAGYAVESIYLPFIRVLFETFTRERVKVMNASAFFADPVATTVSVYRFLGLPDYTPVGVQEINASEPGELSGTMRQKLLEFFEPYNRQLYAFLGEDFGWDGCERAPGGGGCHVPAPASRS
jgi:hypothetical protein